MKVLVADDDASVRLLIKRMLRSLFCEVDEAEDGLAALEKISKAPFSLAIIDVGMPMLSGVEVLQAIRASTDYATLPVIVISGVADRPTVIDVAGLGVTDFLAKPFEFDEFKRRLKSKIHDIDMNPPRPPVRTTRMPDGVEPVLVVDGNAEFRDFAARTLSAQHFTVDVESGQEALRICASCRPSAIIVGPGTGILGPVLLARKLRSCQELAQTPLLLAATPEQVAQLVDTSVFDAVIGRTFVPAEFAAQVGSAMSGSAGRTAGPGPAVREEGRPSADDQLAAKQ